MAHEPEDQVPLSAVLSSAHQEDDWGQYDMDHVEDML